MAKPHFKLKTTAGQVSVTPADLSAHIAVARQFWGVGGFGGLLPNPDAVLKKLGRDISVYRDLLSDPIVAGHVRRRKSAVTSMAWRLDDADTPPAVAAALADFFAGVDTYRLINQILDATLYGYQPLELVWQRGSLWLPEVIAKPPQWFQFNAAGELCFTGDGRMDAEPVLPYKFLCPTHNADYTNPYGMGDLATVYWPTVFKRGGLKFWAEFAEKFGAPWIIAQEPRSNTDADTNRLLDALEQLIGNAVATIPNDSSVEIKEAAGKQGSADVYDRFIRYCRSEIAIALLGQDQTTEKDTNHASAKAGLEVTDDIRDNDCRIVEGCLNQLIDWICTLNFGENTVRPAFVLYSEEVGDKTLAERDQILSQCGVQLSKSYWQRAYNLDDDDIMQVDTAAKATTSSHFASFAEPITAADAGIVVDNTVAEILASGSLNAQGQALTQSLINTLQSGSANTDTVLDKLINAYPEMDDTALQNELARLIFLAGLVGRVEAAGELAT